MDRVEQRTTLTSNLRLVASFEMRKTRKTLALPKPRDCRIIEPEADLEVERVTRVPRTRATASCSRVRF